MTYMGKESIEEYFTILLCIYTCMCVYTHTHTHTHMGFPCVSADKESACNGRDLGLIPEFGRNPGEGKGYPLQYSDLENSMDYIVHGVAKSWTQLSEFPIQYV